MLSHEIRAYDEHASAGTRYASYSSSASARLGLDELERSARALVTLWELDVERVSPDELVIRWSDARWPVSGTQRVCVVER